MVLDVVSFIEYPRRFNTSLSSSSDDVSISTYGNGQKLGSFISISIKVFLYL